MLKKGIGILLAVMLIWGLLPASTAMGVVIEHVTNGSFTELQDGKPTGWTLVDKGESSGFSFPVEDGNVRMRLCPDNVQNGIYASPSENMTTLQGGETYTFSAFLRIESMEAGRSRAAIKITCLDENRKTLDTFSKQYNGIDVASDGGTVSFTFTVPEGTAYTGLLVRNEATNAPDAEVKTIVYWDDISIKGTMKPKTNETDPFVEMPAGSIELLRDGGFEKPEDFGKGPTYWQGIGAQKETYSVSVVEGTKEDGTVHGGTHAVKMKAKANNPLIAQRIYNPVVGATYQASFWYKIDSLYAEPGFKVEWYKNDGKMIDGVWVRKAPVMSKMDEWKQYVYHFTVPDECDYISFMVRLYTGDGEYDVTFDDVSLYIIKEPPVYPVKLSTDEVFYYDDMTEGTATVTLNTELFPDIATTEITLKSDDGTLLWQSGEIKRETEGDTFSRTFPLTKMAVKADYIMEVITKDAAGNALKGDPVQQKLHKYPRPKNVRADGTMLVDDKPFYPVFVYHMEKADLPYAASLGINVSQAQGGTTLAAMKSYLDAAQTYGIKCLVPLYADMKPAGHPDNVANTTEIINGLKDHSALLAWMVMDEATSHWPGRWDLFYDSYKLIRDLDPDHAVYILQNNSAQFEELGKYTDILAYDPYPSTRSILTQHVANNTNIAAEGVDFEKPVWSLNKAYASATLSNNSRPLPTVMEERHMWYQSLMEGASVVGYYSYSDCITEDPLDDTDAPTPMHKTTLYDGLVEFAKEELGESYAFFLEHKYPVFAEGRGQDANAWYSAYVKNGKIYMIVLNRFEEERSVTIPLISDGGDIKIGSFTAKRIYGSSETKTGSGNLSLTLEKSGAYVYEITPAETMDFSALKTTQFHDVADAAWAGQAIRDMEALGIVTGTSPSSFRPTQSVTRGDFAAWLGSALQTSVTAQSPDSEMTRQEMLELCRERLTAYGASSSVISSIRTELANQIAAGNIAESGAVTRAEAAFVMQLVYTQKDVEDTDFGVYNGETRIRTYTPGTFTIRYLGEAENVEVFAGLYREEQDGTLELLAFLEPEETTDGWLVTLPEGNLIFKAFLWDGNLRPYCQNIALY